MTTRRLSRSCIFTGGSLRRRGRPLAVDPSAALSALGGAAYAWDLASDRLTWGPSAPAVLGLAPEALPLTGSAFADLVETLGGPDRDDALISRQPAYDLRYVLRASAGQAVLIQDSGRLLNGPDGRPTVVRGVLRSDPHSGGHDVLPRALKDRTAFLRRLQEDLSEASSPSVTLIVCDITADGPVDPEDVCRSARPLMRRRDHAAMLSATRLALVLTSCAATDAMAAMRRLVGLLSTQTRRARAAAACAPAHARDACHLLRLAERTLAGASANVPATLHDPSRPMMVRARRDAATPVDFVNLLNERKLALALRPIAETHPHETPLARAVPSLASPGRLRFTGAEPRPGLSLLVDGRMLELVADHLVRDPDARILLPIAGHTLRDGEWLPMLAAHLGARPGIASRVIVALPEAVLMEKAKVLGRLDAMKALGIGLALDGFGSGHATTARLRGLPIDMVSIAGPFVQALSRSTADRLFVRTLVDIAQHLGIATLAEGVDQVSIAAMLRDWDVDYLEGDAVGQAAPASLAVSRPQALRA